MKKISLLFSLLYCVSLVASFYTLYRLPTYLVVSQATNLAQLEKAQSVFYQLNIILVFSFVLAGAGLMSLWMERRRTVVVSNLAVEKSAMDSPHLKADEREEIRETISIEGLDALFIHDGDDETIFTQALSLICRQTESSLAAAYRTLHTEQYACLELFASYAHSVPEGESITYRFGEGLVGQVAKQGNGIFIDEVPEGYIKILSGLGSAAPTYLIIHPLKCNETVVGVVEIASFTKFSFQQREYLAVALDRLALKLANTNNVSLEEATR